MRKRILGTLLAVALLLTAVSTPIKAAGVKLNASSKTLTVGKTDTLTLKCTSKQAKKVTWKSSDSTVASVKAKSNRAKAVVTAKKAGTAKITAKLEGKKYTCKVTVKNVPEKIEIDVPSPEWVTKLEAAQSTDQLAVVAAETTESSGAWFSYHVKDADGNWRMRLTTPCFVGKNGLNKTKEGDTKTPTGTFSFNCAFGNADDPGCKMPYIKATEYTYWSGDENYHYNEMIEDYREHPGLDISKCDEHIVEYPIHYQYCLNISYNDKGEAGKGSGIFLHCYGPGKPWTGGCVAIPFTKMQYIMTQVDEQTKIVIDTIDRLGGEWPANDLY